MFQVPKFLSLLADRKRPAFLAQNVNSASIANLIPGAAFVEFTPTGGTAVCLFPRSGVRAELDIDIKTESADCGNDIKSVDSYGMTVGFQPEAYFNAETLAVLYSIGDLQPGDACSTLQGELKLWVKSGKLITFHCAWISTVPNLALANGDQPLGDVVFRVAKKDGVAADAPDAYCEITAATYPGGDAAWQAKRVLSELCKECFTGTWVDADGVPVPGFEEIKTLDGFSLDISTEKEPCETDCDGIIDEVFKGITVELTATLISQTCEQIKAILPYEGKTLGEDYGDLVLTSPKGAKITISGAEIIGGTPFQFGKDQKGGGSVTWRACAANYPLLKVEAPPVTP